jgi:hypothetical protein
MTNAEISELLAKYPKSTQDVVKYTRKYLLALTPGIAEIVDGKPELLFGYGFGPGYKDTICSVMPTKAGVTMGIAWGTELPDPAKLMSGKGKIHRSVKIKDPAELDNPALKTLLLDALAHWQTKRKK